MLIWITWAVVGYLVIGLLFGRWIVRTFLFPIMTNDLLKGARRDIQEEGNLVNKVAKLEGMDKTYLSNEDLKILVLNGAWIGWGIVAVNVAVSLATDLVVRLRK